MKRIVLSIVWWSLLLGLPALSPQVWAAKIVLIAGPITGHPKEAHEYEKCVVLLKQLLETSPSLPVPPRVEIYFNGWPTSPTALDDADTVVLIGDGGDHREQDHPLYVGDRREQFARLMKRGCGCVFIHWTTFHPARFHDETTEWVGGYFDYETGSAANHWYSAIQTWNADAIPVPGHPVTRGVHPYSAPEEFYYRLKFRDSDPRLTPLLTTRPPGENQDFTVGWAVERVDGGRGFGTTGGHFFTNFWQPDFRRLVLNAIVWTAKLEVPARGVDSIPMDRFRTLIVTGANHPAHDWRAVTGALVPVLEQDPRVIVSVTENPEDLAKDHFLDPFALVVWNYVNWERAGLSPASRTNLLAYLHRGGGLSLIHFAASAFHPSLAGTRPEDAWPEWYEHIAARVWEHRPPSPSGHDAYGPFQAFPTDIDHPITRGLVPFETRDELYFHQAGSTTVEPLVVAHSKVTGTNEPLAWAYSYDAARIFETVLGHSADSIRAAALLVRRGSVWAAGRTPLGFDPPQDRLESFLWRQGSSWTPLESERRSQNTPSSKPSAARPPVMEPGTPKISGRDSASQQEADWVDNRWQQTDVGTFLASNLRLPDTVIAKGLTIRVGGGHEGAMAYDLASGAWRAGWTGGFLKFDPIRFGLGRGPTPDGSNFLEATVHPTWQEAQFHYSGLHRAGERVVLDYTVDGVRVLESPWMLVSPEGPVTVRRFWVAPHVNPLKFLVSGPEINSDGAVSRTNMSGAHSSVDAHLTLDGKAVVWVTRQRSNEASGSGWILEPSKDAGPVNSLHLANPESGEMGWTVTLPASALPRSFTSFSWRGPSAELPRMMEAMESVGPTADSPSHPAPAESVSLISLIEAAPRLWPEQTTRGQLGLTNDWLAVDTLTAPYDNPFHALFFASGIDFGEPGEAFVCTIHGDVWRVTGIDDSLRQLKWQRFATGLFQPLGLRVRGGRVLVLGRDRITRLHDQNHDGEADFYENFTDSIQTSTGGHDYVTCLESDAVGNLYYTDPKGIHRVSPDGHTNIILATGWRNPNGLGVRPDGLLTVAPQQGEWTPSSQISEVKVGGYYGYPGPQVTETRPLGYDVPLCWIPHGVDNSSGSQVWLPPGVWGPLGGQMLHLLWGRCTLMAVLRDTVGEVAQGAVLPLPVKFLSGPNRATFNPNDGALYVSGSTGWQTSAVRDGALQRVRWLGREVALPVAWHARTNGLEISFNQALKREIAEDPGSYAIHQWNYRYAAEYGSKDWSVAHPDLEGHDEVVVKSAHLLPDGRSVYIETDSLQPVMQMEVKWNLETVDGRSLNQKIWLTLNRLDSAWTAAR